MVHEWKVNGMCIFSSTISTILTLYPIETHSNGLANSVDPDLTALICLLMKI